jgi:hypothetical protein
MAPGADRCCHPSAIARSAANRMGATAPGRPARAPPRPASAAQDQPKTTSREDRGSSGRARARAGGAVAAWYLPLSIMALATSRRDRGPAAVSTLGVSSPGGGSIGSGPPGGTTVYGLQATGWCGCVSAAGAYSTGASRSHVRSARPYLPAAAGSCDRDGFLVGPPKWKPGGGVVLERSQIFRIGTRSEKVSLTSFLL